MPGSCFNYRISIRKSWHKKYVSKSEYSGSELQYAHIVGRGGVNAVAYNVYIACDRCREDPFAWKNQNVSMRRAKRLAEKEGWLITERGEWYCPECAEIFRKREEIVFGEIVD